jgi:hypothetical protein
VSRLIAHEDRPEGLWGRVKIAATPGGDQLIAEIRDGIRDALSIEASDLTSTPRPGTSPAGGWISSPTCRCPPMRPPRCIP